MEDKKLYFHFCPGCGHVTQAKDYCRSCKAKKKKEYTQKEIVKERKHIEHLNRKNKEQLVWLVLKLENKLKNRNNEKQKRLHNDNEKR